MARDVAGGRQRRTAEQASRIFYAHCNGCEFYNRAESACSECGCPVSPNVVSGKRNKLEVASEQCPLDEPKWPYAEIERRNLIYYLCPLRNPSDVWQWHVEQLRKHLPLFNGRRIVTIATKGAKEPLAIEPAELVKEAFGADAENIEFLERENHPSLWEQPAFVEMLGMVANTEAAEATFYFHAKGVRRARQEAIRLWCQEIYRHNLERAEDAMEALRYWKAAGIARSPTTPGQRKLGFDCGWHFAGTGFWFRHDALFGNPAWSQITEHSHAVEAYLGTQFRSDEVYCLAHDNVGSVYDEATWRNGIAKHDQPGADEMPTPEEVKVSVIVTARNYGRYLRECLESCAWQTHKPHEIIYCDDASEDDSLAIASDLWTSGKLRPFRIVGLDKNLGAVAARNHAASFATGNALLFVDGDDVLSADYLSKMVAKLSYSTPFVYGDIAYFGRENRLWKTPEWGDADLRQANFCNTSSLIWREAFEQAGGWIMGDFGRLPDWHLFLRLAHLGKPQHADVALGYRRHGQSWSDAANATESDEDSKRIREQILASVDAWANSRETPTS